MIRIDLDVKGAEAKANINGPLTGGMVGIPVFIHYDSAWNGLSKTLVCRSSLDNGRINEIRTVVNVGTETAVAHEVMIAGRVLYLGIEGRNADGTVVYPTVWADCGKIQPGANADADATVPATPEAWAQALTQMGSLDGLHTDSKENLVAAINEAMTKGNGLPGADGRGITAIAGNTDGSWTFTYDDGNSETVSNEAYMAMTERMEQLSLDVAEKEQLTPEFANSVEECTDTSKLYVLPDGYLYAYMAAGTELVPTFTNQLPLLTNADGSLYNGGQGWKADTRLSSSGVEKEQAGVECTGYIPVKLGDVIYLGNMVCSSDDSDYEYSTYTIFAVYDKDKNLLGNAYASYFTQNNGAVVIEGQEDDLHAKGKIIQINTANLCYAYTGTEPDLRFEEMAYFRISCEEITDESIITVNEPIEYMERATGYAWMNTGHAFVPADYEDRIIAAETNIATLRKAISGDLAVYGIVDEENNIIMTGTLEVGTYSLKYMEEDGTTTDIGEFTME